MKHTIKPAFISLIIIAAIIMGFYACNKNDNSYGNGGNGTGKDVSIKGFAFSASNLSVAAGTTVTWTNNDAATHTVTADDGSFNSGNIAAGKTFSHTFSAKGSFAYHCAIHTSMTASVVVN